MAGREKSFATPAREQLGESGFGTCIALRGKCKRLIAAAWIVNESLSVQPTQSIPIVALPCSGQAVILEGGQIQKTKNRLVNLCVVAAHGGTTRNANPCSMMLRLPAHEKICVPETWHRHFTAI